GKSLSPLELILNIISLLAQYWQKLAWPIPLNAFYLFKPITSLLDLTFLAALVLVGISFGMMFLLHNKYPLEVFSALLVFLTLIPVLHIRGVGTNVFTERYLYIPSLGFCLLIVCLLRRSLALFRQQYRLFAGGMALVLICVPYSLQCMHRNAEWKDDLTF